MVRLEPNIAKHPPILYALLTIAFAASVLAALFGIMAGMWGGSPSISAFLFWFLPVLSLPVWASYFMLPKTAVILSWLLFVTDYLAFFLGIWRSATTANTTTTNPLMIALGCLHGSPSIPGLFVVAACLHLSARIQWLMKALGTSDSVTR